MKITYSRIINIINQLVAEIYCTMQMSPCHDSHLASSTPSKCLIFWPHVAFAVCCLFPQQCSSQDLAGSCGVHQRHSMLNNEN